MRGMGIVAAGVLLAVSATGGILRVAPGEGAIAKAQAELRTAKAERPDEPWTVVLGAGEYRLSETVRFTEEDSGRDGAPVTWRAEDGAVIRGGADVGPWSDEGGGVVSAALPKDRDGRPHAIDMLFVNGVRASRSVLPKNRGTFKLPGGEKDSWSEVLASNVVLTALGREEWHVGHAVEYTRVGEDAAKVLAAVDPRELQFVQMQVLLDWSQARRRVVGWDGGTRLVKTECFGDRPRHGQYRWCDRSRIRFENVRAGFTDPGDWFCDDRAGRILYRLRAGESAASLRAVAPAGRFSKLLALDGAHDLVFENVTFAFADAPQAKGDDPKRHNQTWQGQSARSYDAGVALANCRDVEFRACRVEHSGNYGFRIGTGCRRVRLVRCSTFDTGAGGVWLGADEIYPDKGRLGRRIIREMYPESCASNVIADCTFRQGGRFQPEGTAIFVTHASDNLITHNLIDDFYYSGITLGYIWGYKGSPSQRNEVSFNRISRIGQDELYDLAAIYTLSASYGTVVSNNVISKVGGNGIYMDEGSEGVLIENNLVTDIDEAGAFMHFGTGCTFRNNIFAFNRKHGLAWASKREAMNVPSSIDFLGNIFYTEDAPLIGERTLGVAGVRAHNVWWNPKGAGEKDFAGLSAEEYLSKGGAYGDVVADPLFVDAKNGDFHLKPDSPALKLGFREWDASLAGPRQRSSGEVDAIVLECEQFKNLGGWSIDSQFIDEMGSSYLIAHGLGKPVTDATTTFEVKKGGRYSVFVRTKNWTAKWSPELGAGRFNLIVNGVKLPNLLGVQGKGEWLWVKVDDVELKAGANTLALHDVSGFDGRCDAICFSTDSPDGVDPAGRPCLNWLDVRPFSTIACSGCTYDLCVVGGGIAGICTAISAARLGLKVALVQDRPVLGGANSSEVRVHLGGYQNLGPYPRLGDVVAEIGPKAGGNAQPASQYEDDRKLAAVEAEKNIDLFLNQRVTGVCTNGEGRISCVKAVHTVDGVHRRFAARLFADCTGDGTVGYLAGADWRLGRESKAMTGEKDAVDVADNQILGASCQWYALRTGKSKFPSEPWMIKLNEEAVDYKLRGDWDWETGMRRDQLGDFETVRDYAMLVAYSNWNHVKNVGPRKAEFADAELVWLAYVAGKRETRRLMGDHILTYDDVFEERPYPDGTCCTTWAIDLHYPMPANQRNYDGEPFRSICTHDVHYPYPIPYRCFYSRNVPNLFMAGRDISVTHVALGTTRVMRTHGMMGEVVGMAASICKRHGCNPRDVYTDHLDELKALMTKGVGLGKPQPPQDYNCGACKFHKPTGNQF